MILNIHAGHNPDGKVACGAVGIIKESIENRKVKDEAIALLKKEGHTVHDCTINNGSSKADVLTKIVGLSNARKVDLDVSIHFNAGVNDNKGNEKSTGVEVLIYSDNSKAKKQAQDVCDRIAKLGFKNRGVKVRTDLRYLKATKSPSMLIECCFVDDKDDTDLYDYKTMAKAIVEGILGKELTPPVQKQKHANGGYNKKGVVRTNGSGLSVRTERNTDSEIIATLKNGDVVNLNYCLDNWFSTYDFKHENKPCYICGEYIELI
jgi:N-acetylmuramoyl-L-alanine amidase